MVRAAALPRTATRASPVCLLSVTILLSIGSPTTAADLAGTASPCEGRRDITRIRAEHRQALLQEAEAVSAVRPVAAGRSAAFAALTDAGTREDRAARISPGLAFLMSAALPGTGQLAEGRNRAFAYLGVEAFAWIARFSWNDAGNRKEGEYEAFARRHWDLERWEHLASNSVDSCQNALPPGINFADQDTTILHFLEVGNYQHYYEDIGKLEAYRAGWDDYACDEPDVKSPNRRTYRSMREKSNDYLRDARRATTLIFLNRVVSAIDAYRTAHGARLAISPQTSLEFKVAGSWEHPKALLRVRRRW